MKKIKNLLVIVSAVILLTGCSMKYENNMKISNEGKMDFTIVSAFDKELIKNLMSFGDETPVEGENPTETGPTVEEMKTYLAENETSEVDHAALGYTKTPYESGEFLGYQFTTTIPNIDTVSSEEAVTLDMSTLLEGTTPVANIKMFQKQGTVYTATFVFDGDAQTSSDTEGETEGTDYSQYLSQMIMDFKYIITLPQAPLENNATSVSEDGKTLTWNLNSTGKTNINFKFELPKTVATATTTNFLNLSDEMMLYIGIGAIVIVIVVVIVVVSVSKKKRKNLEPLEAPVTTVDEALTAVPSPMENVQTPSVEVPSAAYVQDTPVETPVIQETPVVPTTPVVQETPVLNPQLDSAQTYDERMQVVEPAREVQMDPQSVFAPNVNTPEITPIALEPTQTVQNAPVFEPTPVVQETPVVQTPTFETPVMSMPHEAFNQVTEAAPVQTFTQESMVQPATQENVMNQMESVQTPTFEMPSLDSAPVVEIPTDSNK